MRLEGLQCRPAFGFDHLGGRSGPHGVLAERVEERGDGAVVDLQMELETPGPGTDPECLGPVARTGGEVGGTGWGVEGVPVPVQDRELIGQVPAKSGSSAACSVISTGAHPTSGPDAPGNTFPPPARASSWAPRHTPMVGTPRAIASARRSSSACRVGKPRSLCADMGPPMTTTPAKSATSGGSGSPTWTRRMSAITPVAASASPMA